MASAAHSFGTDWLDDVQRDPRTMGAFRRRIEVLLRDAAVARRVSRRLGTQSADQAVEETKQADTARCRCASESPFGVLQGQSIFGLCNCERQCPLMPVEFARLGAVPKLAEGLHAH